MTEPFRVLVADPPWQMRDNLPGKTRGASRNYPTLSLAELVEFPRPPLAYDCVLFLWRLSSMPAEALAVVHAWGLTPKTELVWRKQTTKGNRHFGMGRILRAEHETCIVATRGRPQVKIKNVRSTFEAPVGAHSEKPAAFFEIVESLYDGPYAEMFSRRSRQGWTAFGNEVDLPHGTALAATVWV